MSAVLKKNCLLIFIGMLFLSLFMIPVTAKEGEGELHLIDVTLSDTLDFHISAGTTKDKSTITALNNQPELSSVYISEIKVESMNDYQIVSSETDFSKQSINDKNYSIKFLSDNIDLSQPYQKKLDLKNYEYELSTGIHTNTADVQPAQVIYTLQGQWRTYQIDYELDGGTLPSNAPTSYNSGETMTLPTPTKEGYEFLGWQESQSSDVISEISSGSYGDKTLIAQWQVMEFKISYNVQGGRLPSGYPRKYNSLEGLAQLPTPTKEGYKFLGWTDEDTQEIIDAISVGSTGNKKLIANWEEIPKYNISYDLNGGEFPLKSTDFYSYYDHSNYYDEYTINYGSCDLTDIIQLSTGDLMQDFTLYLDNEPIEVQWSGVWGEETFIPIPEHLRKTCEMRIEYIGYELITPSLFGHRYDSLLQYTSDKEWALPVPTKDGYEFVGWKDTDTQEVINVIPAGSIGDKKLTASWKAKSMMISGHDFQFKLWSLKYNIESIEFLDSIPDLSGYTEGTTKFDVSQNQDKSIYAWLDGANMYIAGNDGKVIANEDCSSMFSGMSGLKKIAFNGRFDTSETTNMWSMFRMDTSLSSLDVSTLDVSNVTDMENLFENCYSLINIDLSSWDVHSVTKMMSMFKSDKAYDNMLTIKTPYNIPSNVDMSDILSETLYDLDTGTEYSQGTFPTGNSQSITLVKTY